MASLDLLLSPANRQMRRFKVLDALKAAQLGLLERVQDAARDLSVAFMDGALDDDQAHDGENAGLPPKRKLIAAQVAEKVTNLKRTGFH